MSSVFPTRATRRRWRCERSTSPSRIVKQSEPAWCEWWMNPARTTSTRRPSSPRSRCPRDSRKHWRRGRSRRVGSGGVVDPPSVAPAPDQNRGGAGMRRERWVLSSSYLGGGAGNRTLVNDFAKTLAGRVLGLQLREIVGWSVFRSVPPRSVASRRRTQSPWQPSGNQFRAQRTSRSTPAG